VAVVFGRQKDRPAPSDGVTSQVPVRPGGKGRPTPKRREAEERNRHPLIGGDRAGQGTKQERKAARQARRQAMRAERDRTRQALYTGDERHLPPRDRGEARRFVRDYVDARRSVGEYFIPIAIVVLLIGLVRSPWTQLASVVLLYGSVLVVAVDSYLLRRRLNAMATQRFGPAKAAGVGTYGLMRALQIRRTRLPRPQVNRGQYPT
jgi:hypothetical protein